MSETETIQGLLRPVDVGNSMEQWCKAELHARDKMFRPGEYENYKEQLLDVLCDYFVEVNDVLYQFTSENHTYEDIFRASENSDGSISFLVKYYNGGCSFGEALEVAINRIGTK